jgi:hypothetical protein
MTEAEAHEFVARWRLILLPIAWPEKSEARLVQKMEQSCKEGKVCSFFICVLALLYACATHLTFWAVTGCVALLLGLAFGCLLWRMQQVRRALDQSPIVNRNS